MSDATDIKDRVHLDRMLKVSKFAQLVRQGSFAKAVQLARVELGESFPLGGKVVSLAERRARN